jgi:hypothetical protein
MGCFYGGFHRTPHRFECSQRVITLALHRAKRLIQPVAPPLFVFPRGSRVNRPVLFIHHYQPSLKCGAPADRYSVSP